MEQIYYHSTKALNPAPVAYPKIETLNNIRKVFEVFERQNSKSRQYMQLSSKSKRSASKKSPFGGPVIASSLASLPTKISKVKSKPSRFIP